jgi:hypothetical protein
MQASCVALVLAGVVLSSGSHAEVATPQRTCTLIAPPLHRGRLAALLRVCDDGTIMNSGVEYEDLGHDPTCGLRGAAVSPDGAWVAFTREGDLSLYATQSEREVPLTWIGQPHEPGLAEVFAGILAWSPDSRSLVYAVCPGRTSGPLCEPPPEPIRMRPASYGYYRLDLATGVGVPIADDDPLGRLLVHHFAWLADGSFLLAAGEPAAPRLSTPSRGMASHPELSCGNVLWWIAADGRPARRVLPFAGLFGQPSPSTDRRRVAFTASARDRNERCSTSQVWTFDSTSGEATPVSPLGPWARYQFPRWSPSGERLAYYSHYRVPGGKRSELTVGAAIVYADDEPVGFAYDWIGNRAILLHRSTGVLLLEVDTGRILAKRCSSDSDRPCWVGAEQGPPRGMLPAPGAELGRSPARAAVPVRWARAGADSARARGSCADARSGILDP